jgi:hypothetical protein
MANVNPTNTTPPTLKVPDNYPKGPAPGKISILFDANKKDIYHRFNPHTDRGSLIGSGQKQPYIWRYPDEKDKGFGRKLPKFLQSLEKVGVSPMVSGADDVERVGEWLTSGYGIQYTIKQSILQAYQPFNETAIYNPLSPLLATIQPMSLGLIDRPTRFIDQGSILGGILSTLGLKGAFGGLTDSLLGKALGRSPYTTIAPGSVGGGGFFGFRFGASSSTNVLPDSSPDGGKGLMRGRTALKGQTQFNQTWGVGGKAESIGSLIRTVIDPLIPNVLPRSVNATYRGDEKSYQYMAVDANGRLKYYNSEGDVLPITQMWYADAPSSGIDSSRFVPIGNSLFRRDVYRGYVTGQSIGGRKTGYSLSGGFGGGFLSNLLGGGTLGSIGRFIGAVASSVAMPYLNGIASTLGISLTGKIETNKRKYGASVGVPNDPYSLENSDALIRYADYLGAGEGKYATKMDSQKVVSSQVENLQKVINGINRGGTYSTDIPSDSLLISSGNSTLKGYNKLAANTQMFDTRKAKGSSLEYGDASRPLDDSTMVPIGRTLRFATTGKADFLNQVSVLNSKREVMDETSYNHRVWEPERDDLIAFFFYDVVNQKYIPFRATVKGINETATAFWEEMKFLGRADQLYSYSGFSRSLTFSFAVVINSLTELMPTWKRINYMASSVKPSNYVQIGDGLFNKFMVPPMFMLNIGDLYKYQPCVITSVGVSVPDDAIWETLNINNAREWTYLNGTIRSATSAKYAQFPREAEISITCNLMEKERPIVGAAGFGHAPHTQDYLQGQYVETDPGSPFMPTPTDFDKGIVEYQDVKRGAQSANMNSRESVTFKKPIPGPTAQSLQNSDFSATGVAKIPAGITKDTWKKPTK